ncbi:MAG: zinc transport system permease protein [Parcubacteria group bacterium Gr01-1014_44]|nr:MAG: zinc transport system permease protein [Parcubacteria group bacterium Gr01-1014_44]
MPPLILSLIVGGFVGLASGYLGSLMVLRRMSLVGDALSHVALPGLALGLLWNFNPFFGAFGALVLAITLIWLIENRTKLSTETLVGIFFTLSLAIGLIITPEPELLEALFGNISQTALRETILAVIFSLIAIVAVHKIYHRLVLGTISNDLASSVGIRTKKIDFIFLLIVALIVALGIKIVGTLLMGALVIIPAASAKNLAHNLSAYGGLSALFGLISAAGGVYLASLLHFSPGPIVVLASAAIFFVSLIFRKS